MTGEDDLVEARGVDVVAHRLRAVGERHRAQVGGVRPATGQVDGDRRGLEQGTGAVPAAAVEAAAVDEDDRDHGR